MLIIDRKTGKVTSDPPITEDQRDFLRAEYIKRYFAAHPEKFFALEDEFDKDKNNKE